MVVATAADNGCSGASVLARDKFVPLYISMFNFDARVARAPCFVLTVITAPGRLIYVESYGQQARSYEVTVTIDLLVVPVNLLVNQCTIAHTGEKTLEKRHSELNFSSNKNLLYHNCPIYFAYFVVLRTISECI